MNSIPKLFAPPHPGYASRREFLTRVGSGFGLVGLASLLQQQGLLAQESRWTAPDPRYPLAPRPGHHPARAKSVIWLFINGGPSQVDTWDYKPELLRRDGQELAGFDRNTGFFRDGCDASYWFCGALLLACILPNSSQAEARPLSSCPLRLMRRVRSPPEVNSRSPRNEPSKTEADCRGGDAGVQSSRPRRP